MCLLPRIPRYITKKCCEDPCHTENYNCDDFEFEFISGIETHKRLQESWAHDLSMNYAIVDATELADPAEPILRNRTTREGIPLWSNWDPVHLAPEAYRELAETVVAVGGVDMSDTGSKTASTASCASHGNRLPEAVVTVPAPLAAKRGRNSQEVRPAGWLHGHADTRMRHTRLGQWPPWLESGRGRLGGRYGSGRRPWPRHKAHRGGRGLALVDNG